MFYVPIDEVNQKSYSNKCNASKKKIDYSDSPSSSLENFLKSIGDYQKTECLLNNNADDLYIDGLTSDNSKPEENKPAFCNGTASPGSIGCFI